MTEIAEIWLPDANSTVSAGTSLRDTLYGTSATILLSGTLGAGKTTFLQGFLSALGVADRVTSPTYALEQRYAGTGGIEILHIDLYRLSEKQSGELIAQSADFTGIRCIEWPERLRTMPEHAVSIDLAESDAPGRTLTIRFDDIALPNRSDIERWRNEAKLPPHIRDHCDAVAGLCDTLGKTLLRRGKLLRPLALRRSAEVHDLLRFIDFGHGTQPIKAEGTPEEQAAWGSFRNRYPGLRHEAACAAFLIDHGFPALAEIVRVHGLMQPPPERTTIEQKLLFYADKRVKFDEVVTLDERFEDFRKRYGNGERSRDGDIWLKEAKAVEEELFGEAPHA